MAEDTSCHLPATAEQQKQIKALIKKHPQSKESHEYEDYIANPTRGNADAFLWNVCEEYQDGPKRDVYLKYIDERPGSNGLFTDEGVPIVMSQVQKEMNEHPGNIWTHIISLRREDAERLGYNNPDAWMHLLRSQRNMIAQQMKIAPENFRWYAAFHNAGHHPHVHMMAYSIKPTEPYLTEKGIAPTRRTAPVRPHFASCGDGSDVYSKVAESLREPEVEPNPEVKQFLHEAAIRGSVDAVYGTGKQYLKTDIQKAISMFELAAEQGNSYAEYQLGKIYCFGQGVPKDLEVGKEWLKASASRGNAYASALLEKVQNHIHQQTASAVFGLFRGLADMIQTSANRLIRRRNTIDRKQRQKIEEKKQAHGRRSSGYEYDYDSGQTM